MSLSLKTNNVDKRSRMLIGIIAVLLLLIIPMQIDQALRELRTGGMDLMQDYVAAQHFRNGQDIFSPFSKAEVSALGVQEELGFGMRQNVHPPFAIALFVPLTYVSFPTAALLWTLFCVGMLFWSVSFLFRSFELHSLTRWQWIILPVLLSWFPVWKHLHLGQWTIPLFGLSIAAWLLLKRQKDTWAGVMIGLATLIKIFPALLIVWAIWRKRYRLAASAIAVFLGGVIAQSLVAPQQWIDYWLIVAPQNAAEWTPSALNISLASVGYRLFVGNKDIAPLFAFPIAQAPTRILLYGIVLASLIWFLWPRRNLAGEFALCLLAMSFLAPVSWDHTMMFELFAFAVILQQQHTLTQSSRRLVLILSIVAFSLSFIPTDLIFLAWKADYLPNRIPGWGELLVPGLYSLLFAYAAVGIVILRQEPNHVQ